jgi:DNA mismatch repair protein MutL
VRFRNQGLVEGVLEEAVREALAGVESSATLDTQLAHPRMEVREVGSSPNALGSGEGATTKGGEMDSQMALFLSGRLSEEEREGDVSGETERDPPQIPAAERPRLWQVHNTYILAETREGLLIIDQHSAHERILFQRLMGAFQAQGEESQRLLFPLTFKLSKTELKLVMELKGLFLRAGFEVEPFGGDSVIVQAVPNPHRYFNPERCFREMVAELTQGSELTRSAKNQHERIAMTFACKGAIKAGQSLGSEEMSELFDSLFATDLPFHDVHGRPTIVRLGKGELERKFGRHG